MPNRRQFLIAASGGALAVSSLGRDSLGASAPATLSIEARQIEVNGRAAKVYRLTGPDGRPGLRFAAGDDFAVKLHNKTNVDSLVHWHGLTPPYQQDGVGSLSASAIRRRQL
jgi:FtsP/CotA-like multicopper oxidase with cupredoxin domain